MNKRRMRGNINRIISNNNAANATDAMQNDSLFDTVDVKRIAVTVNSPGRGGIALDISCSKTTNGWCLHHRVVWQRCYDRKNISRFGCAIGIVVRDGLAIRG